VVVSVADKLEKDEKTRLEAHFGRKLFEVYQATEGFLGISCRYGTLHLNEDLLHFERRFVDETRTAFEPVVSDYFRWSQAVVRFRLDDVLVPQDSCACGSRRQAIREVRGRADDVLWFTSRSGGRVAVWPDFVRHAIQNHLRLDLDFQVVQEGESLRIRLEEEPAPELLALASSELRAFLGERGIEPPALDWSFGLRRGLGEKRKRVERRP
jgi:putative adenylate-forming enzyme